MFFETAGIEVAPWIPPLVAFGISFFTSMGGVSGAFLLLPFQVSVLGYASPSVSATNQLYNIVAIPSGVWRYLREGRMVWPLTWIVVLGTLPGVLIGAIVRVQWLPDPIHFKLFAGCVLFYIGLRLIFDLLRRRGPARNHKNAEQRFQDLVQKHRNQGAGQPLPRVRVLSFSAGHLVYEFYGEEHRVPVPGVFALSFLVGIVGGIYGIGGGAIIAPFFVSFFGLPIYTVAGAALMGTFVTSIAGVAFYSAIASWYPQQAVSPDWGLGLLFGLGGMLGMYLGARAQKFVKAAVIKWMLAFILVFTAGKYALEFLLR